MASSNTRQKREAKKKIKQQKRKKVSEIADRQFRALEEELKPFAEERQLELRRNVPGQEKMSDVLKEFIRPYSSAADTLESYEKLVIIGIFAWNCTLLSENKFEEGLRIFTDKLPLVEQPQFRKFIEQMIERKRTYFPNNNRIIVSCKVADLGDQWHLSVASTLGAVTGG